ncbi:hypothetical protein [Streptomyces sp. SS52]|uniref:hypothetical protein n=1 Tax=Streptomyces sp. SS52 TaxID=2563602 RepID=UPI00109E3CBE|nr:hypothetical protein [Streptomyces sp. SS52]QCB22272.1 hypothetical protein E5N77_10900 [Streptomyces sp. SS52]
MLRLRIIGCPCRALALTDTPRPDCPDCEGAGGTQHDYGHPETGEYAGTEWEPCDCWDPNRCWGLMPLPRWPRRTPPGGYSDQPPF